MRRIWLAGLAVAWVVPSVSAQVRATGSAAAGFAEHRVRIAGSNQAASGIVFGGALAVTIGEWAEISGHALAGTLTADSTNAEDRDVADVEILGGARLLPWLVLQAGVDRRLYTTSLAKQQWTAVRLGAELRVPMMDGALHGLVRIHAMPSVTVSGTEKPDMAFAAGAGLTWERRLFSAGVLYMLERYDFPPGVSGERLEELSTLQARVGLRIGKGTR